MHTSRSGSFTVTDEPAAVHGGIPDEGSPQLSLAARKASRYLEGSTMSTRSREQLDFVDSSEHAGRRPGHDAPAQPMP